MRQRRSFSVEFKRDAAKLVLEQGYSVAEACRSLDVGEAALRRWIEQMQAERLNIPLRPGLFDVVCRTLGVPRSGYYDYLERRGNPDPERLRMRRQVNEIFMQSRGSAGSRSIMGMLREQGVTIGRDKVRSLMREAGLVCKQPGKHAYRRAGGGLINTTMACHLRCQRKHLIHYPGIVDHSTPAP